MMNSSFFNFSKILISLLLCVAMTGCGSFGRKLKSFLGGKPPAAQKASTGQVAKKQMGPTFNSSENYNSGPRRQYKRVTKDTLEEEAQLKPASGSLWVMEGQGAYLFSENIVRMIGDPLSVRIEGESKEQLESKATVIKGLLDKLEQRAAARRQAKLRGPASDQSEKKDKKEDASKKQNAQNKNQKQGGDKNFKVKTVTGRVVERTVDGNYRIKGSQPFMIGPREYKVIVTGIVRAEDFNEAGISSDKLLDPNFDIVGLRKREI